MEEGDFFKGSREYYLFNKENNSLKTSKQYFTFLLSIQRFSLKTKTKNLLILALGVHR